MNQAFFWNQWRQPYKTIFYILLFVWLFVFGASWLYYFNGYDNVLNWLSGQQVESFTLPVHSFQLGPFNMDIEADYYVIIERLFANDLMPQSFPLYIFILALAVTLIFFMSIISTLSRYWYLVGMAAFILFSVSLSLSSLTLFGRQDNTAIIVMLVLYVLPSYYFQSFKKSSSFLIRLLAFSISTLVFAGTIVLFSKASSPLLQLSAYAQTVPLVLCVVFIFMVSHEIPASFITILSRGKFQGKGAVQFLIIMAIYLLNLVLIYLQHAHIVEFNFVYIDLLLLLSISAALGVWGFRNREYQYESIISFAPLGAFLYLSLAVIAYAFIAQVYANANDPYAKVIRDAIIYSHLGYGIIFVTYVASNFLSLLSNNMPVDKVLYKPNRMSYFTFNLAGLIASLAFVFLNNWRVPVYNSYAGYYNTIADVYNMLDEPEAAEGYYRLANTNSYGIDHHSNFVLAGIERSRNEAIRERVHLEKAIELRPSEYAFVDLSNSYYRGRMYNESFRALWRGLSFFPKSGAITNNLGLAYYNKQAYDSAFYFFGKAANHKKAKHQGAGNILAYTALNDFDLDADSLFKLYDGDYITLKANALALQARQESNYFSRLNIFEDTLMTGARATFINNYVLSHLHSFDSADISKLEVIARKPINANYNEVLLYNTALMSYVGGQVARAISLINEIAFMNFTQSGKYNHTLGLWALEQGNATAAVNFLEKSQFLRHAEASFTLAIAYTEAGMRQEAIQQWDSLGRHGGYHQVIAQALNKVLGASINDIDQLTDPEKYQFTRYNIHYLDTVRFFEVVNRIQTPEYKAQALLDLSARYFFVDDMPGAIRIFNRVSGSQLRDKKLFDALQKHELRMLAAQGDYATLENKLNSGDVTSLSKLEQLYYNTLLMKYDSEVVRKNYGVLAKHNPFMAEAVIAAADYFRDDEDGMLAYNILVDAMLLNPQSVKLTKAYILEASRVGLKGFAADALQRLQAMISARAFNRFIAENEALLTEEEEF